MADASPASGVATALVADSDGHAPPWAHGDVANKIRDRRDRLTECQTFELFFGHYYSRLVRFLISQASERSLAEDVAAEAMETALDRWDTLLTYDRPDSWLFKVALRKLRRVESRNRELSLRESRIASESDLRQAPQINEWVDESLDLVDGIRSLPRRQGEAIALHYLAGYTYAETAKILGISQGALKSHLNRGLARLRASGVVTAIGADSRHRAGRLHTHDGLEKR